MTIYDKEAVDALYSESYHPKKFISKLKSEKAKLGRDDYVPAKHNPASPMRPGSTDALALPSLIAGKRTVPTHHSI